MIRAALITFLASPAYAATVPAIQIEECVAISAKDMARDAVERVDVCEWPEPVDLPPLDIASLDPLALKSVTPAQVPANSVGRGAPPFEPVMATARATASASAHSWASAGAFSSSEARCGCVTEPDKPEPSPVPLPAGLPLYAALMGALGLWRWRGWKWAREFDKREPFPGEIAALRQRERELGVKR